jgi:hypothetical protein
VTLWADERMIGEGELPQTVSLAFASYAGMDIGRDNGLVVDRGYQDKAPYAFTGTVIDVVFDLKPVHLEAEKALHEHASVQAVGRAPRAEQGWQVKSPASSTYAVRRRPEGSSPQACTAGSTP